MQKTESVISAPFSSNSPELPMKTIIFDLDGTLVDIEPLFLQIFNRLAPEFGYAPILPAEVATLKKLSLPKFALQRLWFCFWKIPRLLRRGREEYHTLISEVALFPGIEELLRTLHQKGYRLGIVSSSREDTIRALATKHTLPVDFIYRSGLFNKARILEKVINQERLALTDSVYIGDEVRDVAACQKIGLTIIAVTWGLNSKGALRKTGATTVDTREALAAQLLA